MLLKQKFKKSNEKIQKKVMKKNFHFLKDPLRSPQKESKTKKPTMSFNVLEEKYWWIWRDRVAARRYREWREIQDDLEAECEYAMLNDMETEFWCWNCKHSSCDRHKQTWRYKQNNTPQKSKGCAGKTQRGRDCHFNTTSYICGQFYCRYHR